MRFSTLHWSSWYRAPPCHPKQETSLATSARQRLAHGSVHPSDARQFLTSSGRRSRPSLPTLGRYGNGILPDVIMNQWGFLFLHPPSGFPHLRGASIVSPQRMRLPTDKKMAPLTNLSFEVGVDALPLLLRRSLMLLIRRPQRKDRRSADISAMASLRSARYFFIVA